MVVHGLKRKSLVTKGLQSLLDAFGVEIGHRSILATDATRRDRYEARFACFSVAPLAIRLARYSVKWSSRGWPEWMIRASSLRVNQSGLDLGGLGFGGAGQLFGDALVGHPLRSLGRPSWSMNEKYQTRQRVS